MPPENCFTKSLRRSHNSKMVEELLDSIGSNFPWHSIENSVQLHVFVRSLLIIQTGILKHNSELLPCCHSDGERYLFHRVQSFRRWD